MARLSAWRPAVSRAACVAALGHGLASGPPAAACLVGRQAGGVGGADDARRVEVAAP